MSDSIPDPLQDDELGIFKERIFVYGLKPDLIDSPWCVALEPIPATMCGRALAAGIAQVQIDIQGADDKWAYSDFNNVEYLIGTDLEDPGVFGNASAEIIYKSATSGTCWCLIRFPFGPVERIEVVIPEIECDEDGTLTYDTKFIWVSKIEEEGS